MKKICMSVFAIGFIFFATQSAYAAIVMNGNFDELSSQYVGNIHGYALDAIPGTNWDVYNAIPGWTKTMATSGIEIQKNTVVTAHSGNYYVELDSHGGTDTNSSMMQLIDLDAGVYELSFWYRPRTDNDYNDNGIDVVVQGAGGDPLLFNTQLGGKKRTQNYWDEYVYQFSVATSDSYELVFSAIGNDNSLGGFIDTVNMCAVVPEPATMVLCGIASLLGLYTRKIK